MSQVVQRGEKGGNWRGGGVGGMGELGEEDGGGGGGDHLQPPKYINIFYNNKMQSTY